MNIKEIIELSTLITVGVILGIYYSIKAIKNHWLKKIKESIKNACAAAELKAEQGEIDKHDKKNYVREQVQFTCEIEGIPYWLIKKLIDKYIDKIVEGYNAIYKGKNNIH